MELNFRKLKADEVEVRIELKGSDRPSFASALIYMEARTPMAILDETVGAGNWYQKFTFINNNSAMCDLSIYDAEKKEWITKQDVGVGNEGMTKGNDQAKVNQIKSVTSDSFKRAAIMWGIGRELYTSPQIDFTTDKINLSQSKSGFWNCYDKFSVTGIDYDKYGCINYLQIVDLNTKKNVFSFDNRPEDLTKEELKQIEKKLAELEINTKDFCIAIGIDKIENTTRSLCRQWFTKEGIEKIKGNKEERQKSIDNLPNTKKGMDIPKDDFMQIEDGIDENLPFN